MGRRSRSLPSISLARSLPIAKTGVEKSDLTEFLQINSDGFMLAPWTIAEIRSKITVTCRICSPAPDRGWVSPVSGDSEIGEGFRIPQNTKEGFGHVTLLQFRNTPFT